MRIDTASKTAMFTVKLMEGLSFKAALIILTALFRKLYRGTNLDIIHINGIGVNNIVLFWFVSWTILMW